MFTIPLFLTHGVLLAWNRRSNSSARMLTSTHCRFLSLSENLLNSFLIQSLASTNHLRFFSPTDLHKCP